MSTFKDNPPEVKLITSTPDPLGTIYEVWNRSRDLVVLPKTIGTQGNMKRRQVEIAMFRKLIFEFTQIPEFITFSWWIDGMPRSFFDQMTRYRKTGFFARSQRIRDQRGFAARGEYLTTPEIDENDRATIVYDYAMVHIDVAYAKLIELGIPAEDARGILPLHLRTGFGWTFSLRDFAQEIAKARTCHLLQQEYWAWLLHAMRKQMVLIDPQLDFLFRPPCQRGMDCLSRIEAEQRREAVLGEREDGVTRFDLHPCRIYTEEFMNEPAKSAVEKLVAEGKTRWAKSMEDIVGEPE
jgi:thymidylate synthase (FAD)